MLSLGFSKAQLDIGYKPHWFSPLTDSSLLMSTEAPTMPSVSLSNYEPLTVWDCRTSSSKPACRSPTTSSGRTATRPDIRVSAAFSSHGAGKWLVVGLNRLVQFGGGAAAAARCRPCSTPSSTRRATRNNKREISV